MSFGLLLFFDAEVFICCTGIYMLCTPISYMVPAAHASLVCTVYICIEDIRSRRPYSLDCHGGAMGMYHCVLENITVFS